MAGIGFALQRLAQEDNLLGPLRAFIHSAIVAAGPWLITITALSLVILSHGGDAPELAVFRMITMYNFAFSLVLASPLCAIVTRYIADALFHGELDRIPGALIGGLIALVLLLAPVGAWFYGVFLNISPAERYLGLCGFLLIGAVWFVSIFLSAIRDYVSISLAFLVGFSFPVVASFIHTDAGVSRNTLLLAAMVVGLALTVSMLMFRVLASFHTPLKELFAFMPYIRRYWELPAGAFAFNLGTWIDKWIMWSVPQHESSASGFICFPSYDNAMFLAHLSVVPVLSIFVYAIETAIYDCCKRYHLAISGHASLSQIKEQQHSVIRVALQSVRNVVVVQGSLAFMLIFLAPKLFQGLGIPFLEVGIFRFGVAGSMLLTLLLFVNVFFCYLDARRHIFTIQIIFLVLNAVFTLLSRNFGLAYYGYGFTLAALITCVLAIGMLGGFLARLPYQTFVRNNSAIARVS